MSCNTESPFTEEVDIQTYKIKRLDISDTYGWRLYINSELVDGSYNYTKTVMTENEALFQSYGALMTLKGCKHKVVYKKAIDKLKSRE